MKQHLGGLLVLCLLLAALSAGVALAATLAGTTASETINGTKNNDTIDATQGGKDTVNANAGDDTVNINDGVADDFANCGNGKADKVKFDTGDSIDRSCETNGRTEVPIGGTNPPPPPPPPPPPGGGVAMGVFPGNTAGNPAWDANRTGLKEFETLTGKKAKYVEFFHTMRDGASGNCLTTPNEVNTSYVAGGYTPLVRYEADDTFTPDAIIAGQADQCLTAEANQLKGFGGDVLLAPFHEMNGNWMPWGLGQNNTTGADQIAAWKHIHDVFAAAGATNVKFVWNPNVRCPTFCDNTSYSSIYPGDSYVDYIALDGYNWASAHGDSWRSFDEIYSQSYDEITALSQKPLLVAEYSSTEQSGFDKGQWVTDTASTVKSKYPRIKGMLWFHSNQEGALFRVDSSQGSLDAYKAMLADTYYQG